MEVVYTTTKGDLTWQKNYEVNFVAHPNIYTGSERTFNIHFSEPDTGVNPDTGLLLLIAGFSGNAYSNVYKKMRTHFADTYNLVTIQCDYFGSDFMQDTASITITHNVLQGLLSSISAHDLKQFQSDSQNVLQLERIFMLADKYRFPLEAEEILKETHEDFNDMGIMQSIDNISALLLVASILKDNGLSFNKNRIISYGFSHGAYLAHLSNAFAPGLFTYLIDNSAWLLPAYLRYPRSLSMELGDFSFSILFKYLARQFPYDEELLSLPWLYKTFDNTCKIKCFHGNADSLVNYKEKLDFCSKVPGCTCQLVTEELLDNKCFRSAGHGLDADFLELFHLAMANAQFNTSTHSPISIKPVEITTTAYKYTIDYTRGIPLFNRIPCK
jgi:hypothetical protein